ncbi:hypothetical protein, partial [Escherichia coli]|uniref:hypothetical protein n=1 Tax=Escherichia coli TaxID=562 RepID=UPI001BFD5904
RSLPPAAALAALEGRPAFGSGVRHLIPLAEGLDRSEAIRCANIAYDWLTRDWGSSRADRWRVDSYLTRLARRDLIRRYDTGPSNAKAAKVLEFMRL